MLLADPLREELRGRPVSKSGVLSFPVIKHLDVLEARRFHLVMRSVPDAMHSFVFETVEPTLRRRIMPRGQALRSQQFPLRFIEQVMPYALSLS